MKSELQRSLIWVCHYLSNGNLLIQGIRSFMCCRSDVQLFDQEVINFSVFVLLTNPEFLICEQHKNRGKVKTSWSNNGNFMRSSL